MPIGLNTILYMQLAVFHGRALVATHASGILVAHNPLTALPGPLRQNAQYGATILQLPA